jgi:hypothetical protein
VVVVAAAAAAMTVVMTAAVVVVEMVRLVRGHRSSVCGVLLFK